MVRGHLIAAAVLLAGVAAARASPVAEQPQVVAAASDPAAAKHVRRQHKPARSAPSKVMPHMTTHDIMMPQPVAPVPGATAQAPPTS